MLFFFVKVDYLEIFILSKKCFVGFPQKQPPDVFCKKGVLGNLAKFTGKHLCQRLFFNKLAGLQLY